MPVVDYSFMLEEAFVSKPTIITKAGIAQSIGSQDLGNILPNKIYSSSKALLIGIPEFQDWKNFHPLPYTKNDIFKMKNILEYHGFDVDAFTGKITRDQLTTKIEQFAETAQKDDRLILYISSHGYSHGQINSWAYIVPYDARADNNSSSVKIDDLTESLLETAKANGVRHALVILDTCSSGLGIIGKDVDFKEGAIVKENGAHMMTAGLSDQIAQQRSDIEMSAFTYNLAEGLSGKADLQPDGVISLSELLVYVRYHVADETDGKQTPMMGRLDGIGEMVFDLRSPNK